MACRRVARDQSRDVARVGPQREDRHAGLSPGITSEVELAIRRLKRESAELRKANEILKAASVFFAKELDHPTAR